jgi:sugar lactone lactonase YvrE
MKMRAGSASLIVDGIAPARHGDVFIGDAPHNRVVELDESGRLKRTIAGGFDFLKPGEPSADAQALGSVAVDRAGDLYVADPGHSKIHKFDPRGRPLVTWGGDGVARGQFGEGRLIGVAVGPDGDVYAGDDLAGSYSVQRYSGTGRFVSRFAPKGGPDHPTNGVGIRAVGTAGEVFLPDDHLNSVIRYSPSGALVGSFGSHTLETPEAVAVAPNGDVLVANTGGGRIEEFAPDGALKASYVGAPGSAFKDPTALATDGEGAIYVYDQGRSVVMKFKPPAPST